jgi:hypothetical protein
VIAITDALGNAPTSPGRRRTSRDLPPPDVIAQEIVEDLEAALEQFRLIAGDLNGAAPAKKLAPPDRSELAG